MMVDKMNSIGQMDWEPNMAHTEIRLMTKKLVKDTLNKATIGTKPQQQMKQLFIAHIRTYHFFVIITLKAKCIV